MAARPGQPDRRLDPPDLKRAETVEKAHGRIETRRIAVRPIPRRLDQNWPAAARVCRIERVRERKDRCERQVIYALTSLPAERADAAALLDLARAHWAIENRLFRVRDGAFAEDACRVRTGTAPQALAHLRDAALTVIRSRKLNPKPAREAFAANPKAAIRAVVHS